MALQHLATTTLIFPHPWDEVRVDEIIGILPYDLIQKLILTEPSMSHSSVTNPVPQILTPVVGNLNLGKLMKKLQTKYPDSNFQVSVGDEHAMRGYR